MTVNHYASDLKEIEESLALLSQYLDTPSQPEYYRAGSVDEAVSLLQEYGNRARLVAGGIDVLSLIKAHITQPEALVDIKNIANMHSITPQEHSIQIGALMRIKELERSVGIVEQYPVVQAAAHSVASPHIRNMATLAGNLCQEVRCMYYRRSPDTGNVYECHRKNQANPCYAVTGENQYHAVLPGAGCCAVCPSDMATALQALDAELNVVNGSGGRTMTIDELYTSMGTTLEPGEIITSISVPVKYRHARQNFIKFRVRNTIDFAIVSVATVAIVEDEVVKDSRVVLGGVSYAPYRAHKAEEVLTGNRLTDEVIEEAAKVAIEDARPLSRNRYKVKVAGALVQRSVAGLREENS